MEKYILKLERVKSDSSEAYRTIFKTEHGRDIFLSLIIENSVCTITDCFYVDRNKGRTGSARCSARPRKLKTISLHVSSLLSVIAAELDKDFCDVEFIQSDTYEQSTEMYIQLWERKLKCKYHFLIMIGEGEDHDGLPTRLRTRLKNKMHRSVYVDLMYYKDGKGVVKECCYYDRKYKNTVAHVTPPTLLSCFFPYTREGILNLLNNEICCDFTHILITNGIDIDSVKTPLCGAL